MIITRRQLRQLIKEELLVESSLSNAEIRAAMANAEKMFQKHGTNAAQKVAEQARANAKGGLFSRMSPPQYALAIAVAAGSLEVSTAVQKALAVLPTASGKELTYRDAGEIDVEWAADEISKASSSAATAVGDTYDEYVSDYMPWNW